MKNQPKTDKKSAVEFLFRTYIENKMCLTLSDFEQALSFEEKQVNSAYKKGKKSGKTFKNYYLSKYG